MKRDIQKGRLLQMGQMTRTLIIEQGDGAREKEQSYNFMFEQRGNDVLALNTDTGVWKIDSSYSELLKIADTESQSIRIRCNDQIHNQLAEDKLIDHVSEETKYEEFSLLILETSEKCNLRCRYCFESATSCGENMSCETAIKAFKKFIGLDHRICNTV